MQHDPSRRRVIIGVDTHKYIHVAVALDANGGVIGSGNFTADSVGYDQLIDWAAALGKQTVFAIEGTGSYGAGLTSAVRRRQLGVVEVMRTDRRDRRLRGKSDTLDAENAARTVLAGRADAVPKTADGVVEMIRQIKVAKDVAVKARTAAIISLKTVLVNAPDELRQALQPLSKMALIQRCVALRPGPVTSVVAAAKHSVRAIARRWQQLDEEVKTHEKLLAELTEQIVPQLTAAFGVGCDTAAEMVIVVGDNPERIRSEAAFAKLCGVTPIPASSGMTSRHRLNRGGHRQANAALYRVVIVRMQHHAPTKAYVARRTAEGKTKSEIIRCLKRFLARELWAAMRPFRESHRPLQAAALQRLATTRFPGERCPTDTPVLPIGGGQHLLVTEHVKTSPAPQPGFVLAWCAGLLGKLATRSVAGLPPGGGWHRLGGTPSREIDEALRLGTRAAAYTVAGWTSGPNTRATRSTPAPVRRSR